MHQRVECTSEHIAKSCHTGRPQVWPWQHVDTGAVDRERGDYNMTINYEVTGLLTAVWKVTLGSLHRVVWCWSDWLGKEGRRCITCMSGLKQSACNRQLDSWRWLLNRSDFCLWAYISDAYIWCTWCKCIDKEKIYKILTWDPTYELLSFN